MKKSWNQRMNFVLTDTQVQRAAIFLEMLGKTGAELLFWAVILDLIFVAFEIGKAFLPGGAAARVIEGLR